MYNRCTSDVQQMYIIFTILNKKLFYLMVGEIFLIRSTMNWCKWEKVFSIIINSILENSQSRCFQSRSFLMSSFGCALDDGIVPLLFFATTIIFLSNFYCVEMHHIFRLHVYDFVHLILFLVPRRRRCCSVLFLMHWSLWFCVTFKEIHLALYL